MVEIRCPNCAGMICKAEHPPIEGRCSSCHLISLFDGSDADDRARPMTDGEAKRIKADFHRRRKR